MKVYIESYSTSFALQNPNWRETVHVKNEQNAIKCLKKRNQRNILFAFYFKDGYCVYLFRNGDKKYGEPKKGPLNKYMKKKES